MPLPAPTNLAVYQHLCAARATTAAARHAVYAAWFAGPSHVPPPALAPCGHAQSLAGAMAVANHQPPCARAQGMLVRMVRTALQANPTCPHLQAALQAAMALCAATHKS